MSKNLIIVESPAKGRTISRFLGSDFVVESSYGHIRDLPSSKLGVNTEKNFEPQYVIPRKASPTVKKLKTEAAGAAKIILAVDEDREGEAIAWHLVQALGLNEIKNQKSKIKKIERIVFHEITKKAIEEALKNPRDIDMKRVDAQQARRILDRLVGYKLSPFLWKKIYRGLSAGRVQSVAVKLIVEREREVQNFKPEEYWTVEALLQPRGNTQITTPNDAANKFTATLAKIDDKILDKFTINNKERAEKIVEDLERAKWIVEKVEKRAVAKNPLPPFTTSTLQQEAFKKLGFSTKQTMLLAQQLYEGVELGEGPVGLITYMRTDSVNLSLESLQTAREFIKKEIGQNYILPSSRQFKTKTKGAQEAHEAIRPTDPWRTPETVENFLDKKQYRLYDLIWRRFIATQMPAAVFDATSVDVLASKTENPKSEIAYSAEAAASAAKAGRNPKQILPRPSLAAGIPIAESDLGTNSKSQIQNIKYTFRATGQVMKFDGFLKIYPLKLTEIELPPLEPEEELDLVELKPNQHFTEPPPRYTEATLVKALEKYGIGRPSTYAPIISTIQNRGYVEKYDRRTLRPAEIGFLVNDLLVEHFPEIVDVQFTAKMEEELDEIAEGEIKWQDVVREFYEPFAKRLEEKYKTVEKHEVSETTEEVCERCGKPMVVKLGRFGKFLACSGFPECKNTKNLKEEPATIGIACPKCGQARPSFAKQNLGGPGEIVIRWTRRKKIFFGCSRYPACDYASWNDPRKATNQSSK